MIVAAVTTAITTTAPTPTLALTSNQNMCSNERGSKQASEPLNFFILIAGKLTSDYRCSHQLASDGGGPRTSARQRVVCVYSTLDRHFAAIPVPDQK